MYNQQNIQSALSRIENKQIAEEFDRSNFYRAIVVSNDDPMHIGRVKIRIPSLHGSDPSQTHYVADSSLPYAFPGVMQGAGYHEGQYLLPSKGHVVWVSFEYGTDNFIYFGGLYSKAPMKTKYIQKGRNVNSGNPILVAGDDVPDNYHPDRHIIYRGWAGDTIYIDDTRSSEAIVLENRYGNKIKMGETVVIESSSALDAYIACMDVVYCRHDLANGLQFSLNIADIFVDPSHEIQAGEINKGNIVVFNNKNKIEHTGIVARVSSDTVNIKLIS